MTPARGRSRWAAALLLVLSWPCAAAVLQRAAAPAAALPAIAVPLASLGDGAIANLSLPALAGLPALAPSASSLEAAPAIAAQPSLPAAAIAEAAPSAAAPAGAPAPPAETVETPSRRREAAPGEAPSLRKAALGADFARSSARIFDGSLAAVKSPNDGDAPAPGSQPVPVNEDGVPLWERTITDSRQARDLEAELRSRGLDLDETTGVLDDSYADAVLKLRVLKALGIPERAEAFNVHFPGTLTWADAVYNDQESRRTLVDAHRVYFHPGIARSEIAEGTRRAERQLEHDFALYAPGARAERHLGPLERVRLVFDTRGYPEIRERLAARFAELAQPFGDRFQLDFAEDLTPPVALADAAAAAREEFARARSRPEGAIAEGILHSRYVGLIHELRTLAHYDDKGYEILQSGRDLLSDEGMYLTEIDAVVVSPKNRLSLVEAKSMRVPMSSKDALKQKILPKLRGFAKDRALLETRLGHPVKRIVFVVDPGENRKLVDYLRGKQKELSKEYGFRVSFLFLSEEAAR